MLRIHTHKHGDNEMKIHIENVDRPCGSTHNRIVEYASAENAIRYYLPSMPDGDYRIHELGRGTYAEPTRTVFASKR